MRPAAVHAAGAPRRPVALAGAACHRRRHAARRTTDESVAAVLSGRAGCRAVQRSVVSSACGGLDRGQDGGRSVEQEWRMSTSPAKEIAMQTLIERLNDLCDAQPFHTGWFLKDLRTGETAHRHGDEV